MESAPGAVSWHQSAVLHHLTLRLQPVWVAWAGAEAAWEPVESPHHRRCSFFWPWYRMFANVPRVGCCGAMGENHGGEGSVTRFSSELRNLGQISLTLRFQNYTFSHFNTFVWVDKRLSGSCQRVWNRECRSLVNNRSGRDQNISKQNVICRMHKFYRSLKFFHILFTFLLILLHKLTKLDSS